MTDGTTISDSSLFQLARQGDAAAFGQIVDRHKDGLVNYLTRMCGQPEMAEDVAQEAFLRLYRKASLYREQGKLAAYLYKIATNLMRTQARRERRWNHLLPVFRAGVAAPHSPSQHEDLVRAETAERLEECLRRLPLHYRAPLVLSVIEDWSHREIAAALRCSEGTVKSRIHRARKRLQVELASLHDGGDE